MMKIPVKPMINAIVPDRISERASACVSAAGPTACSAADTDDDRVD